MNTQQQLAKQLRADGYRFVRAAEMRGLLEQAGALTDWPEFAATWNDLGPDTYMADGGRYRKRRHAVFAVTASGIARQPAQPHFQSRDYNTLNGGIERWFEPVTERAGSSASLTTVLIFCRKLFGMLSPSRHLARRGASVPYRGATRRGWPSDPRGFAPRRGGLRAGVASKPHQYRQRYDLGSRLGGNAIGRIHADTAIGRCFGRRC